ncbi:helix-turn-helix domain-containing protein [Nocardia rhizosphaerae]|uniref:Helix-turn-helix domain-containing protein n=1 Tax=Nocardia rhizosphaerae TaxID=1691571 RepID=A0ABV8L2H7_9NOCA
MANRAPAADSLASESDPQRVGETLRTIRELRGVTPLRMAQALGISRSYVYNLESGRKPLTYVLLARAAAFLDVPQISIMRPESAAPDGAEQ